MLICMIFEGRLNMLMQANSERIAAYETAVKHTDDAELKEMFNNFIQISKTCIGELISEVNILGGEATHSDKTTMWKEEAGAKDQERDAILEASKSGEKKVLQAYDKVLNDSEGLTSAQQSLIEAQYHKINACLDEIKDLK